MSEKSMKEMIKKHNLLRKLSPEEKATITIGTPYDGTFADPEKAKKFYEKLYPKIDATWWELREQVIAMIEGHIGTLSSIPWNQVSSEDMQKLMTIVYEHRECTGTNFHTLNHLARVTEMAMWCQAYEDDFGNPRERNKYV